MGLCRAAVVGERTQVEGFRGIDLDEARAGGVRVEVDAGGREDAGVCTVPARAVGNDAVGDRERGALVKCRPRPRAPNPRGTVGDRNGADGVANAAEDGRRADSAGGDRDRAGPDRRGCCECLGPRIVR